jgi:predicted kinase
MVKPTLVVVSGPAGSGKTTLAHALAVAVGCPALCRDEIKEGMVHALGDGFEPAPDDLLTQRATSVFFATVGLLLEAGVTVVAEAAFQDHVWRAGLEPLNSVAQTRIVRCRVDPVVGRQRMVGRVRRGAHADASVIDDAGYYDRFVPVSLPVPTIDVDTSDGYDPALERIVVFVSGG